MSDSEFSDDQEMEQQDDIDLPPTDDTVAEGTSTMVRLIHWYQDRGCNAPRQRSILLHDWVWPTPGVTQIHGNVVMLLSAVTFSLLDFTQHSLLFGVSGI